MWLQLEINQLLGIIVLHKSYQMLNQSYIYDLLRRRKQESPPALR